MAVQRIEARVTGAWRWWVLALVAWLLSGCFGGGGGGDDSPPPEVAPVITAQPTSQSVTAGTSAAFTVVASGGGLVYQWQRSTDTGSTWADVAGAAAASYATGPASAAMNGHQFRVRISSGTASVTSSAVTLSVSAAAPVSITVQPAPVSVAAGADATFTVTAGGTAPAYQWQDSLDGMTWTPLTGATNATLMLNAVGTADNGRRLRVVVSNALGSVTSNPALLTVTAATAAPAIVTQPAAASVTAPAAATFTVVASGTPPPVYQWQQAAAGSTSFADIAGATAASFATGPTAVSDDGRQFRVRVGNSAGEVISSAAVLSVTAAPVVPGFTLSPAHQSVTAPSPATFTVGVTGTPTPTLQWQLSIDGGATYINITGATGASYTTPATATSDSGRRYRVVASNSAGSATSAAGTLTVAAAPAGKAFVYVSYRSSALISGHVVDRSTGALTDVPGSPLTVPAAADSGFGLALHPNGRFLYVVQGTRTWVYAIDATTGALTPTAGSPYTTAGLIPLGAPVFAPGGSHVLYPAPFQPASYAVDATTGALTATGSVTLSIGSASTEFSADGQFLFLQDGSSNLRVLRVAPLTLLSDAGTSVAIKTGSPFHVRGGYLLAQPRGTGVASYAIGTMGVLTPVQTLAALGPNLVAHPNGRCFYMSGEVSGTAPMQSIDFTPVTLDLGSGAIAADTRVRVTVPGTVNRSSYPLQMNPSGSYGYLSTLDGTLLGPATPVALDGSACSLAPRAAFDPGPLQLSLTFDPAGRLLFNHSASAASLFVSAVDPLTRVPAQVTGSPFALPGLPMKVVVR